MSQTALISGAAWTEADDAAATAANTGLATLTALLTAASITLNASTKAIKLIASGSSVLVGVKQEG